MGPRGPREEIADLVRASGCVVRDDPTRGGVVLIDCPNYRARCDLIDAFAWSDAHYDGELRLLALSIARACPDLSEEGLARCIQHAVASRVRYVGEAGDVIQDPIVTWEYGLGDCDCQTRLVVALCRALGVPARVCGWVRNDGEGEYISHAVGAYEDPTGALHYMETTLGPGAGFGEDPIAAVQRLGAVGRSDVTG